MTLALLSRWGLRHHLHHPLRSGLAVLGIALGVALFVGIRGALGSATDSFEQAATALTGRAAHCVRAGPDGVPTEALRVLGNAPEVAAAAPVTEGHGYAPQGRSGVRWFGCDPFVDGTVRPVLRRGGVDIAAAAALVLLTRPGAFAASSATLRRLGKRPGESVDLVINGRTVTAHCALELTGADELRPLDDVLVVDIATAQEWSGRPGTVDRIDLVLNPVANAADGDATARVQQRLVAALGPALRVVPVEGHAAFADLTAAFRMNLHALGFMALLVGAFLVHAAMRGAVTSRQIEFALLRALGASSRRIEFAIAREALLLGLCGSACGCALGLLAAHLLVGPLVASLNDHYAQFSVTGVAIDPWLLLASLLLGTAIAVLAAVEPAREAGRAPPRAVFASARLPHTAPAARAWLAVPLLALGLGALWLAGKHVALAHAGLLLLLLAAAAAAPAAIEAALRATVRVLRRAGPWLAYVARSAAVSRHRTGSATASLVLAVAMTTGLGIMIRSFRDSVGIWLDEALPADVYVGVRGRFGERQGTVVEPTLASELQRLSGVGAATTYRRFQTELVTPAGERRISDVCVLEATPKVLGRLPLLGDADAARRQFAAGAGALASEPLAFQLSLRAGDVVTVATDAGPRALPIAGILRDYRSARGELTLPRSWYGGDAVSSLALECAPGTDADTLEGAVWRTLRAAPQDLDVATQPSIRVGSMHVFDRSFAITAALRVLCIGIAVLGIYGAFASLQLERRHEVGVLRALGAGPAHVALLVLGQTTLLGLWAGVLSLPVGIGIGHALVHVVNRGSFGWTLLEVEWPPALLGEALLLSLGAAFVAGLEPAWRMVRTAPATALRED